jgi:hypothetical protein
MPIKAMRRAATMSRVKDVITQSVDPDGTICFRLEEVDLTAEELSIVQAYEESLARNEGWLSTQWPRLIPACLGQWLAVAGQEPFVARTREAAEAWVKAKHADDPGAFVDHVAPFWKDYYEGKVPQSESPRTRIEHAGRDEGRRLLYLERRRRELNEDWLSRQWPWLLPSAMGKHVGVANERAVVLDTLAQAQAWREANVADDPGCLIKQVHPFHGPRMYPNHACSW